MVVEHARLVDTRLPGDRIDRQIGGAIAPHDTFRGIKNRLLIDNSFPAHRLTNYFQPDGYK
ncbi:hypothetical protein D3C71_1495790 [compost metagenome]